MATNEQMVIAARAVKAAFANDEVAYDAAISELQKAGLKSAFEALVGLSLFQIELMATASDTTGAFQVNSLPDMITQMMNASDEDVKAAILIAKNASHELHTGQKPATGRRRFFSRS